MKQQQNDRHFAELLKLAGERDLPSSAGMERARLAAQTAWQRTVADVPATAAVRRRWVPWTMAAAASLALVLSAAFWWRATPVAPELVARVSALQGEVRLQGETMSVRSAEIFSGALIESGEGRLALSVGDALSLRLDRHTRLRFDAPSRVTLLSGKVYVDSGGINTRAALNIVTPAGVVRHVGTQFQVRVAGNGTQVRVREGRVLLGGDASAVEIAAGEVVDVRGGEIRVLQGQHSFGEHWDWAAATSPAFDIENRPLAEFLAWLAREHGWQLQYADAGIQSRAQEIRLHGSLTGLDPTGMLERVALITGVRVAQDQGVLSVEGAP
jgi:ferric-dicitrate binding protein FerR (iron transport regulator)